MRGCEAPPGRKPSRRFAGEAKDLRAAGPPPRDTDNQVETRKIKLRQNQVETRIFKLPVRRKIMFRLG